MTTQRGTRIRRWAIAVPLGALALALASRDAAPRQPNHHPDGGVPRLDLATGISLGTNAKVGDIALADGRLFVLDGAGFRVLVVDTLSGAVTHFGRRGGGPGEFQAPMSLALSPHGDTIAVADARTVHFFGASGAFHRSVRVSFPCDPRIVNVAWLTSGLYLSTSCLTAGADTVHALVWKLRADGSLDELARTARYSMDGGWGSPYGARTAIAESGDSLLFGPGSASCVQAITSSGAGARHCALDAAVFRAPPPSAFRPQRGGVMAALLKWPDPLPSYIDRIATGADLYLMRMFSHDSVVVRHVRDAQVTDVLVAPLDPIVRCRGNHCFWAVDEIGTTRIVSHRFGS
ncbi:MAG: hypothetical protein ACREKM_04115 [Longimicrobiales bacterium]